MRLSIVGLTLCAFTIGLLLSIVPTSESLRILGIFPLNSKSHFVMNERLMRGLAERGHQVDVYGHFPLKKPPPNYTDYSIASDKLNVVVNNMSYEMVAGFSSQVSIKAMLAHIGTPICELLELPIMQNLIKNPPNNPPYDLVIVEHFVANCHLAWGRHFNLPMIAVVTLPPMDWTHDSLGNPDNPAVNPSIFSGHSTPMTFFQRLENFFLSNIIKTSFRYYMTEQDIYVEKAFGHGYPSVTDLERDVSLALINYHHQLNGIRPFTPAVVPVGGLHIVDHNESLPKEVKKFLDESKDGFIYFSFGSMVRIETFPKPILDIFYNTFKKIVPVRVLMKIAKPEKLPPGLPSNVITYHWLPQVQVLKHENIKAFITHGGLMGTQESAYYGVPMIGIPLFGDQHLNMKLYVKKNIAIKLDLKDITQEAFMNAVTEIVKNPMYKESAKKVSEDFKDTPMSPIDTAVFWVEYIARHGKDALRSPIVDMPWWQASLLDVYGLIIICLLAVLYIVKLVLKKCICAVMSTHCKRPDPKVKRN